MSGTTFSLLPGGGGGQGGCWCCPRFSTWVTLHHGIEVRVLTPQPETFSEPHLPLFWRVSSRHNRLDPPVCWQEAVWLPSRQYGLMQACKLEGSGGGGKGENLGESDFRLGAREDLTLKRKEIPFNSNVRSIFGLTS
jgi:hypothetical protein